MDRAEERLRRTDLLDEHAAIEASKRLHFRRTAKWILPAAGLSVVGVGLGAWEWVLTFVAAGLLGYAAWVFMGANARLGQIEDELGEGGEAPTPPQIEGDGR